MPKASTTKSNKRTHGVEGIPEGKTRDKKAFQSELEKEKVEEIGRLEFEDPVEDEFEKEEIVDAEMEGSGNVDAAAVEATAVYRPGVDKVEEDSAQLVIVPFAVSSSSTLLPFILIKLLISLLRVCFGAVKEFDRCLSGIIESKSTVEQGGDIRSISREDFSAILEGLVNKNAASKEDMAAVVEVLFKLLDKDGNGVLDQHEFFGLLRQRSERWVQPPEFIISVMNLLHALFKDRLVLSLAGNAYRHWANLILLWLGREEDKLAGWRELNLFGLISAAPPSVLFYSYANAQALQLIMIDIRETSTKLALKPPLATSYASVCRVSLGDPIAISDRDREQAALGPDLLQYERKELIRASKRIKTKSASRAKQLALRTRAAAAAAATKKPVGATSGGTAPTASRSTAPSRSAPPPPLQHTKRSTARLQHARLLERYGDLTRLSLETQSQLEDSEGRIQRLLKRRGSLSEQRIQIDEEVTALQRKIRDMVAATLEAAAAQQQQQTSAESDETHETASASSSQSPPATDDVIDAPGAHPKPTHHVPTNPHLSRARARLGKLVQRWKPNQDRDDRIEKDREEAEEILAQRQPSPKRRRSRPPEISIDMASAVDVEEGDGGSQQEEEEEDMEILTEGGVAVTDEDMDGIEGSEEEHDTSDEMSQDDDI
ncbi:hypothetical protein FOL47_009375 [Perkinsus chesapeaki]|uniref:EF-hand domain-containing protein n=1 Tax=Perkinsus chesapeaki TaxID=330153 RepID=A0A7J6MS06_PERCH|nr:hypothetical protein FOL47_009375 [Perkinsus chesapeaki]